MINYKGVDLDYFQNSLKGLVIKGGLTKVDSLSARTTISSTEFDLPRTAKNELAFGNITTEGAQSSAFGSANITIDGNVFSTGTLYVKGYNDSNFQCVFFGADGDLIKALKNIQLADLFPKTYQFGYNDIEFRSAIENETGGSLGQDIRFHYGHPFLFELEAAGNLKIQNVAPFFNIRHMLYKMMQDNGLTLHSNFLDSDYGSSLDYSEFDAKHLGSNTFYNGTNQVPLTAPSAAALGPTVFLNLGTPMAGNASISPLAGSYGTLYTINRNINSLKISGTFEYVQGELDSAQISVFIPGYFYSSPLTINGGTLREGTNEFTFEMTEAIPSGSYLVIAALLKTSNSYPLADSSITCTSMTISHDGPLSGDAIYLGDYIGKRTQLDFLKGFIKQCNLVLEIDGNDAYLELQDVGYQPVGTATILPSISVDEFDLTNLISAIEDVNIDYLQGDLIYLNQKLNGTDYTSLLGFLEYQDYGSYLFDLNTFGSQGVDKYESYFNCMLDSDTFTISQPYSGDYLTSWDNCISSRFKFDDVYDGTINLDYINGNASTTNLDCLVNWSEPVMLGKTWEALFKNTLEQKKNNKIKAVVFKDELGTIVSNRRTYIIDNQKYKIIDWSYDLQTKLVKANLIMK